MVRRCDKNDFKLRMNVKIDELEFSVNDHLPARFIVQTRKSGHTR